MSIIDLSCQYHPKRPSVVECKGCKKPLCEQCHDEEHSEYCFACALDLRNKKADIEFRRKERRDVDPRMIRKVVGWYEIIGGALGILSFLSWSVWDGGNLDRIGIVRSVVYVLLFLISIAAGFLLLKHRKYDIGLSICIQVVQVVQFLIKGTFFSFLAGAQLSIQFFKLLTQAGVTFQSSVLSRFNFYIEPEFGFFISFNFVPLIIIFFLINMRNAERGQVLEGLRHVHS